MCGLIVLQCDKSTALHFACTQGALDAIKIMLSSYNRVEDIINLRDGANQTPYIGQCDAILLTSSHYEVN